MKPDIKVSFAKCRPEIRDLKLSVKLAFAEVYIMSRSGVLVWPPLRLFLGIFNVGSTDDKTMITMILQMSDSNNVHSIFILSKDLSFCVIVVVIVTKHSEHFLCWNRNGRQRFRHDIIFVLKTFPKMFLDRLHDIHCVIHCTPSWIKCNFASAAPHAFFTTLL